MKCGRRNAFANFNMFKKNLLLYFHKYLRRDMIDTV